MVIPQDVGSFLASASAAAYVSGYLALRSRAHALGTDPAFKLVDEAYVFAGVRFLFISAIVLLLAVPVILRIRWAIAAAARHLSSSTAQVAESLLLAVIAMASESPRVLRRLR